MGLSQESLQHFLPKECVQHSVPSVQRLAIITSIRGHILGRTPSFRSIQAVDEAFESGEIPVLVLNKAHLVICGCEAKHKATPRTRVNSPAAPNTPKLAGSSLTLNILDLMPSTSDREVMNTRAVFKDFKKRERLEDQDGFIVGKGLWKNREAFVIAYNASSIRKATLIGICRRSKDLTRNLLVIYKEQEEPAEFQASKEDEKAKKELFTWLNLFKMNLSY